MAKKRYKVPFYYENYGYIPVEADTPEEAVKLAKKRLKEMDVEEMLELTEYLDQSESIDEEGEPLLMDE